MPCRLWSISSHFTLYCWRMHDINRLQHQHVVHMWGGTCTDINHRQPPTIASQYFSSVTFDSVSPPWISIQQHVRNASTNLLNLVVLDLHPLMLFRVVCGPFSTYYCTLVIGRGEVVSPDATELKTTCDSLETKPLLANWTDVSAARGECSQERRTICSQYSQSTSTPHRTVTNNLYSFWT